MINANTYKDEVLRLLDNLYETQKDAIEQTAQAMAKCIENGGVIQVFGSGHSVGLAYDVSNRPGSLVPIHICTSSDAVVFNKVSLEEFSDKKNSFERKTGVAQYVYDLYDIRENDIFFVISNSGINGIGIDFAKFAREHGHTVIVITSMSHTLAEDSRHPTGLKLYQLGSIVIDNCGPHGDALLPTTSIEKVTAVSSICNNAIVQAAAARTIELLQQDNYPLPILTGDEQHDEAVKKQYEGRI